MQDVDPGSPAWEVGLVRDDEIVLLYKWAAGFLYDPDGRGLARYKLLKEDARGKPIQDTKTAEQAKDLLEAAEPNQQMVFVWKRDGKEMAKQLTTVRRRNALAVLADA